MTLARYKRRQAQAAQDRAAAGDHLHEHAPGRWRRRRRRRGGAEARGGDEQGVVFGQWRGLVTAVCGARAEGISCVNLSALASPAARVEAIAAFRGEVAGVAPPRILLLSYEDHATASTSRTPTTASFPPTATVEFFGRRSCHSTARRTTNGRRSAA